MTTPSILYRASHLLLGDRIVENGAVEVHQGVIVGLGKYSIRSPTGSFSVRDLGDGIILPGLVNAHTHLEFSSLETPLGQRGIEFTQWIRLIVKQRMAANSAGAKGRAIESGLRQCFDSGTWLIGEIATSPCSLEDYLAGGLRSDPTHTSEESHPEAIVFLEQLGRSTDVLNQQKSELESYLRSNIDSDRSYAFPATSPHAPYSVGTPLLEQMVALNQLISNDLQCEIPIAMHVAETRQERELLEQGSGPFVDLLKEFGVWDPSSFHPPTSIKAIIKLLSSNRRSLVVHGNYLTDSEMDLIASSDGMSVIFCPRTHSFFEHDTYPLLELLERGINVAIGTDSRASNPDLDLFAELKQVARSYPQLDVVSLLALGTKNGANALGRTSQGFGCLAVGQTARMSFVRCPAGMEKAELSDWMWHDSNRCEPIRIL